MWLLIKNALLRIKDTIGRFFSLFFIVALGLGFFAGIKATSKDMYLTADKYYDDTNLYDYKIASTYGLNEDDINSLKNLKKVKQVEGAYFADTIVNGKVYRVHSILDTMNHFVIKKGNLPKNNQECLAENGLYEIGDIIKISANENLKSQEFKVVGLIESPLYIGIEKGISNIGNGKLNSYIYVNKDTFKMDFFTEAYLIGKGTKEKESYEQGYEDLINELLLDLEKLKPIRETLRYEEVMEEVSNEITKNENKIKAEESKNNKKLNDAKDKLTNAKSQIQNGKKQLQEGKEALIKKEKAATQELAKNENEIKENEKKYLEELNNYNNNKDEIQKQIETAKNELNILKSNLDLLKKQIDSIKQIDPNSPALPELETKYLILKKTYEENLEELKKQEQEFVNAPLKLEQARIQIETAKKQIEEGKIKLSTEISSAKDKIKDQELALEKSNRLLTEEEKKYNEGVLEFKTKINEAYAKIDEEKEKLNDMPKPVWYLLDRTDQTGYIDFKHDAMRVDNIAKVFPVFFLLVAALVCLNTMTRMVEEDRTEIGIYKALGYSNIHIILNYFLYVIVATLFGGIFGLLIGYQVFPRVIYSIYKFTYTLPELVIYINPITFTLIILIALIITLSVTLYSCYKELQEVPSNLLRPKAPKNGKKVFLEKIPFIWNKLNFSAKVTVRNIFRYKKRIFMTIIGIAGCTALTLTGFGLKDGISSIINKQYEDIFTYQVLAVLSDNKERNNNKVNQILSDNNIENQVYVKQDLYHFKVDSKQHDFFLVVPDNKEKLLEYVNLQTRIGKEKVNLTDDGAIITEKMAKLLNADLGDVIKIRDSDNKLYLIKVNGIVENYAYHYVYMTKEYYQKIAKEEPVYNTIYANLGKSEIKSDDISTNLIDSKEFLNVTFTKDTIKTFDTMINSLNKIVLVIIASSCLLAIIVLYNLTNINIIERKRELATLKVLGFYNTEVSSYVYRETMLLTIMGIVVGLIFGVFLHHFVMDTAEMDFIMFMKEIKPASYVYATIITIMFSFIVAIFTHFKLKKIDMIESLKSVE